MLKILSKALDGLSAPQTDNKTDDHSLRVAMAALLVHASRADGHFDEREREKILHVLKNRFSLAQEEALDLLQVGSEEDHKAVDLYGFTKTLTSQLDQAGRLQFVKMMWQVILVDGVIDDFESHLIWRVSDLLGVSTRDRVLLRQQIEGKA